MGKSLSTFIASWISLSLVIGSILTVNAVTYPVGVPTGEVAGGTFNTYFSNMFATAGISESAPSYLAGCQAGEVMRGMTSSGMLLCISPGLGSTSSATLSLSGSLIGTPNYLAKYTPTGTGINNSQIYDNGTNVGIATISPSYKLDVAGTGSFYGLRVSSGAVNNYVLTSDASGMATWRATGYPCIPTGAGIDNACYGSFVLQLNTTGFSNTAVGSNSLRNNTSGYNNSAFGQTTLQNNTTGLQNTAIGSHVLINNINGNNNTSIGVESMQANINGSSNTVGGYQALMSSIGGSSNSVFGYFAGRNLTGGDNNTALGSNTDFANTAGSNQLNIANIIFGNGLIGNVGAPVGNVGIGTANPTATLEVAGQIKITGGSPGSGKTLISDGSGLARWADTVSGSTATGIVSGFGNQNYIPKFGSGGVGIYTSQLYDDGFNIGVGTITPGAKLDVAGQIRITGGAPGVNKVLSSDATGLASWVSLSSVSGVWSILGNSGTVAGTNFVGTNDLQDLVFKTNNIEAARILTSGNVGIGTPTPGAKLEVAGQVRITGGVPGVGKVLTSDATGLAVWSPLGAGYPCIPGGSMPTNTCYGSGSLFSILNGDLNAAYGAYSLFSLQNGSNNTGIGHEALYTNRNGNRNTAVGFQASYLVNNPSSDNTSIGYRAGYNITTGINNIAIGSNTNLVNATSDNQLNIGNAIFGTNMNGTVAVPSGNIGIGTNNPTAKLEVAGQVRITGGMPGLGKILTSDATGLATWSNAPVLTNTWNIIGNSGTIAGTNFIGTTDNQSVVFRANNAEAIRILTSGDVGIGTATPGAKLEVAGQVRIATAGAYLDYRPNGVNCTNGQILTWNNASTRWECSSNAPGISGSGLTTNYLTKWNGTILSNSQLFDNGTNVGIGTAIPGSKLEVVGNSYFNGNVTVSGSLIVDKIVNRTVNNVSISGSLLPDSASPLVYRDIGSVSQRWNNLFLSGQVTIAGGAPGLGKILTSDANGLAVWSNTVSGSTATGITGGTQNYIPKFGTGGTGLYLSQFFDNGTNVGIGTITPGAKLEVAGQVRITGGAPGAGRMLVSDATGLATWTGVVTATGINIASSVLGSTLYYNGTAWVAGTGIYNTGGNIGIGTALPTSRLTIDSGINGSGGLRLSRISATTTPFSGPNIGLGVDGSGNLVPVSNGDVVVYTARGRNGVQPVPDPDLPNRLIGYNFNTYFAIPTSQSFVVSDGNGAGYNAPYFKENGTSGICSGGGSPYDCAVADPFTGLSASPNNSFTMTAKGSTYGYQMALGARGDAPLFARSGRFTGAQTNGLFLSDGVTPTPWQKVLTVPANHLEYFYVNIGYNSQLQAIAGGGNVGIGTSIPDRRLVIAGSGTVNSATQQLQVRRGVQGADASLGNTYGTPYVNIGGQENRVNSIQTIGFGKSALGAAGYAPAEIGFLTTSVAGGTQGDIVFANRNGTTNVVPTEVMRIESTGDVGIGVNNPTQQLQISRSMNIPATTGASTGVIYKGATRFLHNYTSSAFSPNIFLGLNAGNFTMTQGYNIGIGDSALALNTIGFNNMALGYLALSNNTTGANNAAIGSESLELNQTGNNNVANGFKSLYANLTGGNNTSIGTESLVANDIGSNNTANGYQAMSANTSGNFNTAIGGQTLFTNISGQNNTAIGYQALRVANSPSNNTAIGYQAGNAITTGASNIVIGANAQVGSPTGSNQLSIGNWLYGSGGNIGIGIATPVAKLEVAGNFKLGTNGAIATAAGVCTIASTAITTTAATYTCTGVPASTAVAIHCNAAAAFTTPNTTSLYCRTNGTLNQVVCNTTVANSVSTTYKCMWMQ